MITPTGQGHTGAGAAPGPARVLLADDHALVRHGVRLIIDAEPDLQVVAEVADGAAAVERCVQGGIDLAILDVSMPRMTGLQAAREISRRGLPLQMLILSMHDNEHYLFEALKLGAAGYVHKSVADRDLITACRSALRGEPFLYPAAVATLIRNYLTMGQDPSRESSLLTPREEEVLKLIAEGHSGREIADLLVLSPKTVERHRANMLEKLGMKDRLELTRYAIRTGLIEP
ncbi:MAG: response regulator transcription factor [Candidatus Phosphoribacter sp.]|nr:response regulator transcription factor [Actinomycetales bacterium]